jgi:hypothetical protein
MCQSVVHLLHFGFYKKQSLLSRKKETTIQSDLVAMVHELGLETFKFLCRYSVFVQVVPINRCLYEE